MSVAAPAALGFATALAVGLAISLTRRWHGALSYDDRTGPQKFHDAPTPRIGGLAVYAGACAAALASPPPLCDLLWMTVACGGIALAAGLAEDITGSFGVFPRLAATVAAGVAFCLWSGYTVAEVGVPVLNEALAALPAAALVFTAFGIGGVAHAVNIIDGFHGLATGTAVVALFAFAGVSLGAGDAPLASFCLVLAAVLLGFLPVNFPGGHVFLGDGGAYLVGFLLAAVAVMVPVRNPEASAWASAVVLAYPLLEVAFSVTRKVRRDRSPYRPDGLHLHMLVYRRYGKRLARAAGDDRLANPATGVLMWGGALAGSAAVVIAPNTREWSLAAFLLLAALYALAYRKAARVRK